MLMVCRSQCDGKITKLVQPHELTWQVPQNSSKSCFSVKVYFSAHGLCIGSVNMY